MIKSRHKTNVNDLYHKLVGAGFSFVVIMIVFIIQSSLSLYELSDILTSPWLWIAFYGYGLLSSFIIDWIGMKLSWAKRWALLLYIVAGFIIFFPVFGFWITILVAGPVGALAAALFYFGVKFVSKNKWTALIFAFILPILLLIVSITDFTQKEDWEEFSDPTSYKATFVYFNGEHKIPVKLEKEEKLLFNVDFHLKNDGGWGQHLENINGKHMPIEKHGDMLLFTAKTGGEYYIVVHGNRAKGNFTVSWESL